MGSKRPLQPAPRKRRRRNHNNSNDIPEIKDDGILDLTLSTNNTNNSNNGKGKRKYTTKNKISYFGPAMVTKPNGEMVNLMVIRNEVFEFTNDQTRIRNLLESVFGALKRRALGADICYSKKLNSNNKMVLVKKEFMSHIDWASKPEEKGGGATRFSPIENIVLVDGACPIVARFWQPLKCQPALGILASGNIGKLHPVYVVSMVELGYGQKYKSLVHRRSSASLGKRMKTLMTKKTINADAVKVRSTFIKWGSPTDVTKTNLECIKKSTSIPDQPQTEQPPQVQSQPWLPVKVKTKPTSKIVHEKALNVLNNIEKEMAKIKREDEEKQEYLPKDMASIPNIIALPPIPSTVPTTPTTVTTPTTKEPEPSIESNNINVNGLQLYEYISVIYDMQNQGGITDKLKESTVSMLLKAWHSNNIDGNKEHVMNIITFVQTQSGLSDSAVLRLLRCDLTEFLKANDN